MHVRPRQTDRRTNIMAIARRFVLTNASRAKNQKHYPSIPMNFSFSMHIFSNRLRAIIWAVRYTVTQCSLLSIWFARTHLLYTAVTRKWRRCLNRLCAMPHAERQMVDVDAYTRFASETCVAYVTIVTHSRRVRCILSLILITPGDDKNINRRFSHTRLRANFISFFAWTIDALYSQLIIA